MPFEKGNDHGKKGREFGNALRRALKQHKSGNALRLVADRLIDCAIEGEQWAVRELADRLDGKPQQAVDVTSKGESIAEMSLDDLRQQAAAALAGTFVGDRQEADGATDAGGLH